jgi:hypothetical protein
MSEVYYQQQQPTLSWNIARGVWEKVGMANLLCEHWELFSQTWQVSGWMRNGQVFELPTQAHHTTDSESLSSPILRTPAASEAERGHQPESKSKARGGQVTLSGQMMTYFPTPNTMDHLPARTAEQKAANKGKGGYANVRETVINDLIPTPTTRDHKDGTQPHERDGVVQTDTVARAVFNSGEVTKTNWGKFEPAIRRWEKTLGRPAPAPTKPDGKDGAHRLSSAFTEWMMGVPEGWITGVGLTRNEELKACGNGVVPQQAELALRVLLEGIALPLGGGQVNLPTPTVSDTFTDNLASTQQKPGSMHSVTLPQAVRMVSGKVEVGQELTTLDPQTDNATIGDSKSTAGEGR